MAQKVVSNQRNEKSTISNNNKTTANDIGECEKNDIDFGNGTDMKKVLDNNDCDTDIQQKIIEQVEVSRLPIKNYFIVKFLIAKHMCYRLYRR